MLKSVLNAPSAETQGAQLNSSSVGNGEGAQAFDGARRVKIPVMRTGYRDGQPGLQAMMAPESVDRRKDSRFSGPATFFRSRTATDFKNADIAVFGICHDMSVTGYSGTREGPRAVRNGTCTLRPYDSKLKANPFEHNEVYDCGDIYPEVMDLDDAHEGFERVCNKAVEEGATPFVIGGAHDVFTPNVKAAASKFGPLPVVYIDSHGDDADFDGHARSHGSCLRRAIEAGAVDTKRSFHLAMADDASNDENGLWGWAGEQGMTFIGREKLESNADADAATDLVRQTIGNRPYYLSIDIDHLHHHDAPSTGTVEEGGIPLDRSLRMVRALPTNLVAADLVEVKPGSLNPREDPTTRSAGRVALTQLVKLGIGRDFRRVTGTGEFAAGEPRAAQLAELQRRTDLQFDEVVVPDVDKEELRGNAA